MSTYTPYTWPNIDIAAVCAEQDLASPGNLTINGTLSGSSGPNQASFITANFIRSVSINSPNDLSGTTFSIQGFQNGGYVSETITGPNSTIVYGTQYYDVITQVTASTAVTQVSVGTGNAGYLPLIIINSLAGSINYGISAILPPAGSNITYSLLETLESISFNYIAFQAQLNKFFPVSGLINVTTSQLTKFTSISNYLLFHITSTNPLVDSLSFTFLQE